MATAYLDSDFSPGFNIRAAIYSHNSSGNEPGSQVGQASDWRAAGSILALEHPQMFVNISASLVEGTTYWFVLECDGWGPVGGNDLNWAYVVNTITPGMKYFDEGVTDTWKNQTNSSIGSQKYCLYSGVNVLFMSGVVPPDYYYTVEDTGNSAILKIGKLGDLNTVAEVALKDKTTIALKRWAEYRIIGSTA